MNLTPDRAALAGPCSFRDTDRLLPGADTSGTPAYIQSRQQLPQAGGRSPQGHSPAVGQDSP